MKTSTTLLTAAVGISIVWLPQPHAQEESAAVTENETANESGLDIYVMPHERADFYTNGTVKAATPWEAKRDPFWPINWTVGEPPEILPEPTNVVVVTPVVTNVVPEMSEEERIFGDNPPNWMLASRQLKVISKKKVGETWLVSMQNLGVKEEGSVIQIEYKRNLYTWRIAEIHSDSIRYERVNVRPK